MGSAGVWGFAGVDPGVTSGIAWGTFTHLPPAGLRSGRSVWKLHAASCDPEAMLYILGSVLEDFRCAQVPVLVQGEKFVTSRGPGSRGSQADVTRKALTDAQAVSFEHGARWMQMPASDVKAWGSDKRLEAAGFPLAPKLKDARDAGRHLLFAAVKSGRAEDPLC